MFTISRAIKSWGCLALMAGYLLSECPAQSNLLILEKTHTQLFDHFFPDSPVLTPQQKSLRTHHKQVTWEKIKSSSDYLKLLGGVSESTSPNLSLESLSKSNNPEEVKLAFNIRKAYLSLCYADAVSNQMANITPEVKPTGPSQLTFPKSGLTVKDTTIFHKMGEIDILIIGSGPAGSLIASELRKKKLDAHIVMVEAGSFVDPLTHSTALDPDLIESNNLRTTTSGGIILRNGRAVGGGTTVNINLAFSPLLPFVKEKLNLWNAHGLVPKSFFHHKPKDWERLKATYAWVASIIGTRSVTPEEINANNILLLDAVSTARTYDLNEKPYKPGSPEILKNGSFEKFILPTLHLQKGKGSFSLLHDAKTLSLNFKNTPKGRIVTGIQIESQTPLNRPYTIKDINQLNLTPGKTYTINARTIILSAGTLGSAELLLRSKINNTNIGKGIVIHPSMGIIGQFDREINAHQGLSASVYAPSPRPEDGYFFESMGDVPSFIALIHPGSGEQILDSVLNFRKLGGFGVMLVDTPHPDNKVFIDPKSGKVEVAYSLGKYDSVRFKKSLIHGVTALFKVGAKSVFIPSQEIATLGYNPVFKTPEAAIEAIQKMTFAPNLNFVTSAHMQGSNKMGSSPKTSVVSTDFKVWDGSRKIPNLYLVDSSIFPTSVGANPMQTVYTFAKIFVEGLSLES